jgi:hypothetical protein
VSDAGAGVQEVDARLVFASGEWGPGRARVIERSPAWRRSSALVQLSLWLLIPVVFFIPPHIPWVLLLFFLGAYRAFNRFREHRTLVSLHGTCPKCGTEQDFPELGRMRHPHVVRCRNCQWDLRLDAPLAGAAS